MKKALFLAVAIAGVSTTANAAWDEGYGGAGSAPGELALTVWNTVTSTSFTQDLGVDTYLAMDGTLIAPQSFTLDAAGLAHVAGNLADIKWNVGGGNSNAIASGAGRTDHVGFYMTANSAPSPATNLAVMNAQTAFLLDYAIDLAAAPVIAGTAENPVFLLSGADFAGTGFVWGEQMGGLSLVFDVSNTSGNNLDTLLAYSISFEGPVNTAWVPENQLRGSWQLDMASGVLNYNLATAVPVPAAVWLLGSALLSIAGIGRARRMTA